MENSPHLNNSLTNFIDRLPLTPDQRKNITASHESLEDFIRQSIIKTERTSFSPLEQEISASKIIISPSRFTVDLIVKHMNILSPGKTTYLKNEILKLGVEFTKVQMKARLYANPLQDVEKNMTVINYLFNFFHIREELENYAEEQDQYPHIASLLNNRAYFLFTNTLETESESNILSLKIQISLKIAHKDSEFEVLKEEEKILKRYNDFFHTKNMLRRFIRWPE